MNLFELNLVASPFFGLLAGVLTGSRAGILGGIAGGVLGLVIGVGSYYLLMAVMVLTLKVFRVDEEGKYTLVQTCASGFALITAFAPPYVAALLSWLATAKLVALFAA